MKRYLAVGILVLLCASLEQASGQFGGLGQLGQLGLHSKRETYSVPVSHPPELVLPNVKRIAITGFNGANVCSQAIKDRLSETITRSGTFELIDRTSLGSLRAEQNLQASAFADPANAVKLGKLLGPAAVVSGNVTRCDEEDSGITSQQGWKDKKGRIHTNYSRSSTAHAALSVQVIDVATSKVVLFRTIAHDSVETQEAQDGYPAAIDGRALLASATLSAEQDVEHLLFGWMETIDVTVHADKECDLKPAAEQIRGGDFTGAAATMQKAIDRQCGAPDDKIALAKAYHNRGVALTYAGRPEEGLRSLQQSDSLWPGNISKAAIVAAQKLIAANSDQKIQDAAVADASRAAAQNAVAVARTADASMVSNKDIIDMVQAKLSDQIIISQVRTAKCKFDTSPSSLIQLKKAGASDAVVMAMTQAQCAK
jgi:curli biogenesis system outer membrane secretion channel CsgG